LISAHESSPRTTHGQELVPHATYSKSLPFIDNMTFAGYLRMSCILITLQLD